MLQKVIFQVGEHVEPVRLPVISLTGDHRIKSTKGRIFKIKNIRSMGGPRQVLIFDGIEGEYPAIAFKKTT